MPKKQMKEKKQFVTKVEEYMNLKRKLKNWRNSNSFQITKLKN